MAGGTRMPSFSALWMRIFSIHPKYFPLCWLAFRMAPTWLWGVGIRNRQMFPVGAFFVKRFRVSARGSLFPFSEESESRIRCLDFLCCGGSVSKAFGYSRKDSRYFWKSWFAAVSALPLKSLFNLDCVMPARARRTSKSPFITFRCWENYLVTSFSKVNNEDLSGHRVSAQPAWPERIWVPHRS